MMTRGVTLLVVVAFGLIFAGLLASYQERDALRPLAEYYVANGPGTLGAPNVITGLLITYRGFDTLGEVAVLFMVAASVGVLLAGETGRDSEVSKPTRPASEIVQNGARVLLPLVFLFGAYVIMHGHLSAGGGFQGGAIVASAMMLMIVTWPDLPIPQRGLSRTESAAGVLYVLVGVLGLIFAGGFLDSRFLPSGEFGALVSAGAIPVISTLLGIKVGAELSVIIDRFRG
jgi:multicomponent Na+:H+ antiporter subunit B